MKALVEYSHKGFYFLSHSPSGHEKEIIVAFHGYGQLAEFFLKKFTSVFNEKRLVIVPEATNYSYQQGFSGRVGANWMTSHEREMAIQNNNNYLNKILESVLLKFSTVPVIKVLGFSQGAATATRWIVQRSEPIDTLVLWSGGFAHDLEFNSVGEKLKNTKVIVAFGDEDDLVTPDSLQKQNDLIASFPFDVKRISFKGGHEINIPLLKDIFA
jgi:predicted esterase